jgi:hypothetical protein
MYDNNIVNYIVTYFLLLALVPHYAFHKCTFIGQIYYGIVIVQQLLSDVINWHRKKYRKTYWCRAIHDIIQYAIRYMSLETLNLAINAGAEYVARKITRVAPNKRGRHRSGMLKFPTKPRNRNTRRKCIIKKRGTNGQGNMTSSISERRRTKTTCYKYMYLINRATRQAIPVPRIAVEHKRAHKRTTRNKNRVPSIQVPTIQYGPSTHTNDKKTSRSNLSIKHPTLRGSTKNDIAFSTQNTFQGEYGTRDIEFGTDSFAIKVDNCASRTMSFQKSDFIAGTLKKVKDKGVRGFGNTITKITHDGTIKWRIYDDNGMSHDIIIPNSYYVPAGKSRLLSPQHWSQQANDNHPAQNGTWCATYHDSVVCYWDQQKFKITVPIDPGNSNVGTIYTASGVAIYHG